MKAVLIFRYLEDFLLKMNTVVGFNCEPMLFTKNVIKGHLFYKAILVSLKDPF